MKTLLTLGAGLFLVTLGAGPWRTAAAQDPVAKEPAGLEERVAALETKLAGFEKQNEETRKLVEDTVRYLEQSGKAALSLHGVLDQVQEQGFAVGENWKSRETLLTGLRAYLAQNQTNLPKLPAAPPPPKPAAPARRPARQ